MRILGIRTNLILTRVLRRFRQHRFNYFDDAEFLRYAAGKSYAFHQKIHYVETLALRDSHADYGFYPTTFPKSFNLGLTSGDLYTAFQIYRIHQKDLVNLKGIILYFGVFSPGFSAQAASH